MAQASDKTENKLDPLIDVPKCAHALAPLSPDQYGPIITVAVGKGKNQTAVELLWDEGSDIIKLTEDDPEVFRVFFHWLYTGKLYFTLTEDGRIPLNQQLIISIFLFGDARGIANLCNASVDLFCQSCFQSKQLPIYEIRRIYENELGNSTLRKFMVNHAVHLYTWPKSELLEDEYPQRFLLDVIELSRELKCSPEYDRPKKDIVAKIASELCSKFHVHTNPQSTELPSTSCVTGRSSSSNHTSRR